MPDLHVGLSPRATHIAVEGIKIPPSSGCQNVDLCHPGSSRDVFNLILFHPGAGNAPVLTSFLLGRLSQSDFLPAAQGFLRLQACPINQMHSQMGIAGVWAYPAQPSFHKIC